MRLRPLSSTLPNLAALLLALWTLLCNAAVWMGLGLDLVIAGFFALLLLGAVYLWRRPARIRWSWMHEEEDPAAGPGGREFSGPPADVGHAWMVRTLAAALGAWAIMIAFALRQDPSRLAWLGIPFLAVALLSTRRSRGNQHPRRPRQLDALLVALGVLLALLTLAAHRPDADDCFYVNLAVQALDEPTAPLLHEDGMYGIEGMPLSLPVYRVHSWEILAAAIARLHGPSPIHTMHWVLPTLAAILVPFVFARLFRILVPSAWWLALLIAISFLILDGSSHASYGNYAFVRLHQGKAVLLSVALPFVLVCAMEYARRPSRAGAFRLWTVQTAAVGLSSSGLLVVPVLAWLGLFSHWRGRWDRRLWWGAACSIHPLLLMALLAPAMRETSSRLPDLPSAIDPGSDPSAILDHAIKMVLGQGRMRLMAIFFAFAAWAVPRDRHAARVLVVLPLAFLLFSFNPWVTRFADTALSREVWFRGFWILPIPVFVAVGLSFPAVRLPRTRGLGVALAVALAVWSFASVSERSTLSTQNETVMAWPPRVKAPPLDYQAARFLVENTDVGARVVAPEEVAIWVPTFAKRTYPLYTRYHYQRYLEQALDPDEVHVRRTLIGFVSSPGTHLEHSEVICYNSARFQVDGWAFRELGRATDGATSEASECRFSLVLSNGSYRVWTRRGEAGSVR